jgi:large subunit ribosomal protein L25
VDISGLESVDDSITVADLKLGDKITILTDPEEVIVSVSYAQEKAAAEAEAVEEPEVVEKGKKEEAE